MPLAAGNRLGSCEILASVGAGGMGEEYRPTDTNLHRGLALKVPPSEMAQDPERLAPFRREALTMQLGRQKADPIKVFDGELLKLGGKPAGSSASRKKASACATGMKTA
jgi:hypothetical protein